MHHAIAISRVIIPVGMLRFAIAPSPRLIRIHRVRRKRHEGHTSTSGLAGQQVQFLIGLLRDGRIGIFGLDLRIQLGGLRGIILGAVMFGESQHNHRLRDQYGRLGDQILVQLHGFVTLASAVVHLGQFEPRHSR